MTNTEVRQVIAILAAAFPNVVGRMSPDQARAWAQIYAGGLVDLEFDQAKAAVDRLIKSSQWLSIAEIRAAVLQVTRGQVKSGLEAWGDVLASVAHFGFYRTPKFDDPITEQVVRGMGWKEICSSENQVADRARFVTAYDQLAAQGRVEAQVSQGAAAPALPARDIKLQRIVGDVADKLAHRTSDVHVHRFVNDLCTCGERDS